MTYGKELSNGQRVLAVFLFALVITGVVILVFHFFIFPTGVEVLRGFDNINVTPEFTHALYFFVIGIFIVALIRSIKVQF